MVIGSLLEKGFGASLSSRTDIVGVWNKNFLLFYKFFFGKVKTIFWESESKCSKLFKSKFGNRKFYRKLLWSDLEIPRNVPSIWKCQFLVLCNFWVTKMKPFFGEVRQNIKSCLNKIWSWEPSYKTPLKLPWTEE